jgi:flavin-dependent dehydrogenase
MSDHLIVIPAWNEAPTIGDIVRSARGHGDVLVVDDGSTDDTAATAASAGADVIRLERRAGKAAALRRGLAEARARGADRVLTMDGDGQHDPGDIPRLLQAAAGAPDALVIGNRLGGVSGQPGHLPPGRLAAMRVAGFFINWLTGVAVSDTQSGFRVYPAGLLEAVTPSRQGFVFESEMLIRAALGGWRLIEVPVAAIHFPDRKSRFRPVGDGVAVGAYLAGHIARRWAAETAVVAAALARPFTAERRRPRHRELAEFTAPLRGNPPGLATAVGVFMLHRTAETWRRWWGDPRARRLRLAAAATAATPALLGLALAAPLWRRLGVDPLGGLVRSVYSQDRLAGVLPERAAEPGPRPADRRPADVDVLVIGGGPGGAATAALLGRGGLSVAIVERERYPRFHIGESLLPANLPLLERLGVMDEVRRHGFIVKHGASFHDQESGRGHTFYFLEGKPWPPYAFEVPRAEFDGILLRHAARQPGVTLHQPAAVEAVAFHDGGALATLVTEFGAAEIAARFVVDATGRDAFMASRHGRRRPMPGLGKVALFAHFRGARRWPGRDEGNIRIYLFDGGWFWWIPFAGDVTSVGCVLHARTVRGRERSVTELFEAMVARCELVAEGLAGAARITPVHSAANFSYATAPSVGDRFLSVGDAVTFVDPIFSTGVFVAMQSAELAAAEILAAFREDRFGAARFARYERRVKKGVRPFLRFIRSYYDPAFLEVFLAPRPTLGILGAVTGVLAGGTFMGIPLRTRLSLELFFAAVRITRWARRRHGRPVESRLEW